MQTSDLTRKSTRELISGWLRLWKQERGMLARFPGLRKCVDSVWLQYAGPLEREFSRLRMELKTVTAELIRRGVPLPPAHRPAKSASSVYKTVAPMVAARLVIICQNPNASLPKLSDLFDEEELPILETWKKRFEISTWGEAHQHATCRKLLKTMISKDRRKLGLKRGRSSLELPGYLAAGPSYFPIPQDTGLPWFVLQELPAKDLWCDPPTPLLLLP